MHIASIRLAPHSPSKVAPTNTTLHEDSYMAPKPNILRRVSTAVDRGLTRFYQAEGCFVARRPYFVILLCALLTGACMIGFTKFTVEEEAEKLYTPQDEPSFDDQAYVDSLYNSSESMGKILALDKEENGKNILLKPYLLEHMRAWRAVVTAQVEVDGRNYTFADRCVKEGNACKVDSLLYFWGYDPARLEADNDILATINNRSVLDYNGKSISLTWLLGGIQRDQQGAVIRAEALQTVYYLEYDPSSEDGDDDEVLRDIEERITEICYDDWQSPILAQYVSAPGAIGRESSEAINSDVSRLTVGYLLLIAYTFVVFWRNSWVYQKVHVALGAFAAIGLGIGTSFGMLAGFGVKFNFVVQVLPFLLVGVGVDNAFVILSIYFDQDPDSPVEHRISRTMGLAGASVTVSSLTNIIAFAVGCYTSLEALLSFSIYASVSMIWIFIYMVTFFIAILVLDARREMRMRAGKGCCGCAAPGPCIKDDYQEHLNQGLNGWSRDTDIVKHAVPPPTQSASRDASSAAATTPPDVELAVSTPAGVTAKISGVPSASERDVSSASISCWGARRFHPHADGLATKIIARWLPKLSLNIWGKVVVVLLECVMLGFAVYGCTKVYQDFNFRELFVPEGNWLFESYKIEERYFGGEKTLVNIYTKTAAIDGRDYFDYQDQLAAIAPALRNTTAYISTTPAPSNWYNDYIVWLNLDSNPLKPQLVGGRPPTAQAFNAWLKQWVEGDGRAAADNIKFNATGHVISSYFTAYTVDVIDSEWAIDMVDAMRRLADTTAPGLQAFAYGPEFTFIDGFRSITLSTVTNVIIAAAAVFVVTLILLADIIASLEVFLMVVLSDVGVLGVMHYLGLTFNSVTCIVLVLAVGISVDYSAHVMRAFLVSTGTRQERAHKALQEIGGAVWNGAISTFLAVVPMAVAQHYIFTTIFQMFSVLILLAIWHGVVLLPVLLSWVGPASYREVDDKAAAKAAAKAAEKALPA